MRLHRIISAGLLFLSFCAQSEPLFWLATQKNIQLMLVGSIHVGHPSMYPLPAPIINFLQTSDALVVEADTRQSDMIHYPPAHWATKQVLTHEQLTRLDTIAKQTGLNPRTLQQSPPWLTAITIQMQALNDLGYQAKLGIDQYFLRQAASLGKPVIGLESVQFQIDMLANLPQNGKELLISALDEWNQNRQTFQCMIKSWHRGDITALRTLIEQSTMSKDLTAQLEVQRNRQWAKKLLELQATASRPAKYLVVVGTLHLIGQQNLLQLLQRKGFQITQLNKSQETHCE
jgi:uncharacterized protein YbaP (TraB family)